MLRKKTPDWNTLAAARAEVLLPNNGHQLAQYPMPFMDTVSPEALAVLSRELMDSGSMTLHTQTMYNAMIAKEKRKDRNGLAQRDENGRAHVEYHRLPEDELLLQHDLEMSGVSGNCEPGRSQFTNIAEYAGLFPAPCYPKDASTANDLKIDQNVDGTGP